MSPYKTDTLTERANVLGYADFLKDEKIRDMFTKLRRESRTVTENQAIDGGIFTTEIFPENIPEYKEQLPADEKIIIPEIILLEREDKNHHLSFSDIYAIDGSVVPMSRGYAHGAFVKCAAINDSYGEQDQQSHQQQQIHLAFLPLASISYDKKNTMQTLRIILEENISPFYDTLAWLFFDFDQQQDARATCWNCRIYSEILTLDCPKSVCKRCGADITMSDTLGFEHFQSTDGTRAIPKLANVYMSTVENLMLFDVLRKCTDIENTLFIKDGPLSVSFGQRALLSAIRAAVKNVQPHILGQEKTGKFVDHHNHVIKTQYLDRAIRRPDQNAVCIPTESYIKKYIVYDETIRKPGEKYGADYLYGSHIMYSAYDKRHNGVFMLPDTLSSKKQRRILDILPDLFGSRFTQGLYMIEAAHKAASIGGGTIGRRALEKLFEQQQQQQDSSFDDDNRKKEATAV